jgi:hypothetical protein
VAVLALRDLVASLCASMYVLEEEEILDIKADFQRY